jgi:hypothetical protein
MSPVFLSFLCAVAPPNKAPQTPDAKTAQAIDALELALQQNRRADFQTNAQLALTTLEQRKNSLHDPATAKDVALDLDTAKHEASAVKAASEQSWQNVGFSLKLQLTNIDEQLDKAEHPSAPAK